MKPIVALTTTIDPDGGKYQKPRIGLYVNYVTAVEKGGVTPLLITPAHTEDSIRALMEKCDGLVLSGGEDIDPSRYGHDAIPQLGIVNPARDKSEFAALQVAVERDIPILGICRGHQLLNVFYGGTLCQDIQTARDDAKSHQQTQPWGIHHHGVTVEDDTRLAKALGCTELKINSYHHQAVQHLGDGLKVTARADDGLVEGIEGVENSWVVGVQWHPERHDASADNANPDVRLFEEFGRVVREGATVGAN